MRHGAIGRAALLTQGSNLRVTLQPGRRDLPVRLHSCFYYFALNVFGDGVVHGGEVEGGGKVQVLVSLNYLIIILIR